MWRVIMLSVVLMTLVFVMMGIRILIKKNGKFPNTHIGGNKAMAERGIQCATTQDKMARKRVIPVKPMILDEEHESNTTSC